MATLELTVNEIADKPDAAVVNLSGAIGPTTVVDFQRRLTALEQNGKTRLVLNFEGIKYVNSTGLGSLVKFSDKFSQAGGGIVLSSIPTKVKVVFKMLGLHNFFRIYDSDPLAIEALDNLGKEETGATTTEIQPAPVPQPTTLPTTAVTPGIAARPGFPLVKSCSGCQVALEVPRPGNYRCPRCATILSVSEDAKATFLAKKKPAPIQMNLTCSKACTEGFRAFLREMATALNMPPASVDRLVQAMGTVCGNIAKYAYDNDPNEFFNVLVVSRDNEFIIKIADHGKTFGANGAVPSLDAVKAAFDAFDHQPHPRGGNILTMVKKITGSGTGQPLHV